VNEPLVTARELAAQLGCSTGALLRWTRAGQVPAVKLPSGAVRFRPEEIERWLAERATGTAGRGVSTAQTSRAHGEAYAAPVQSLSSTVRPLEAAPNEEDSHAS
jgi:excisionase family DNA binding protein